MRFLFTCGGTAGHINPALGVAGRIRELMPDADILFVGAEGKMETELVPREGYPLRTIRIRGFQRGLKPKRIVENIRTAELLAEAMKEARRIVRDFQPDVAVGTGGYVCYPVLRAASSYGVPTAVHESNAVPGLTTRLLERRVDRILVGLEESRTAYRDPSKVELTGTPVRVEFRGAEKTTARRSLGLPEDEPIVLAVFGSLGAGYMNECMEQFIGFMGDDPAFRLIYGTGRQYYDAVRAAVPASALRTGRVDLREYIYDMPRVMAAADVILCRAGASTISELTYLGRPAVIVPSPNVVNHHQEKNARVLADAGAAKMLLEGQFTGRELYDTVMEMLGDTAILSDMASASERIGVKDATDRITGIVLALAESKKE